MSLDLFSLTKNKKSNLRTLMHLFLEMKSTIDTIKMTITPRYDNILNASLFINYNELIDHALLYCNAIFPMVKKDLYDDM